MAGSTNISTFALGGGANVLDPVTYAALPAINTGYEPGIAQSQQFNTTLRQSAFMAAALANFIAQQGFVQNDDGNLANAVANIGLAVKALTGTPNVFTGGTTTGSANAQVLATVIPSTGFALNNGFSVIATAGFTNTGATTMNIAGTGVQTVKKLSGASLVALTGGEIVVSTNFTIVWNSTAAVWVLQTTPTLGALAFLGVGTNLQSSGGNLNFNGTRPTFTTLTSGSGTYTTPAGCVRLKIRMLAGGGAGGGAGAGGAPGSAGTGSSFGSTTAGPGQGGGSATGTQNAGGNGGTGGTTGTGTQILRVSGGKGGGSLCIPAQTTGGSGAPGFFGGGGVANVQTSNGISAAANSGAGGSGAVSSSVVNTGQGGGSGEYVEFFIDSPAGTYSYVVGVGGTPGAGAFTGGAGGSGIILIEEIYY